jgi:hypothetical protein
MSFHADFIVTAVGALFAVWLLVSVSQLRRLLEWLGAIHAALERVAVALERRRR